MFVYMLEKIDAWSKGLDRQWEDSLSEELTPDPLHWTIDLGL